MPTPQYVFDLEEEISCDGFAGGGGVSTGYEMATGLPMTLAFNHNGDALSMHEENHPQTRHLLADAFEVDPVVAVAGRPLGYLHLSPDCTHHSQAAGGQPRDKKIRALSWVMIRWLGQVAPRVASLEKVKQIRQWGPLIAKRDPATGRVIKLVRTTTISKRGEVKVKVDEVVAAPGERVPVQEQYLVPGLSPQHTLPRCDTVARMPAGG